jgi:nicotinate-nucleotide pyrophosphorylase (carboxylating)
MAKRALPRLTDLEDVEALDAYLLLALEEDGAWDDATSLAVIPASARAKAGMIAKEQGVFCGGIIAERLFRLRDAGVRVHRAAREGRLVRRGARLLTVEGALRSILSVERTALNFAQRLSGIATMTRRFVEAAGDRRVSVLDTRKTTPLWRALERHAVRCGGGKNHRFALDDMILIKNNHADAVGSVERAVERAREKRPDLRVAAEARDLRETEEAARAGADIILLDNMGPAQARRAVRRVGGRARVEITGGLTLRNAAAFARAGADRLSVGALTHSAPALDLALHLFETPAKRPRRKS